MRKRAYLKMTKKDPTRGFKKLKQKYLTKQRLFAFLAKIRLVDEVSCKSVKPLNNELLNRIVSVEDMIETDRGSFRLSYLGRAESQVSEWYYASRFTKNPKKLYDLSDEESVYLELTVRAECESFIIKIDPFNEVTVTRHNPCAVITNFKKGVFAETPTVTRIEANFLNARLGTKVSMRLDKASGLTDGIIAECLNRARVQMRNYIEGNAKEINERLTGIKHDGELYTPDGFPRIENCICRKCGNPVFHTPTEGYFAQCVHCDEDLYVIEVSRVDPVIYRNIYENSKKHLFEILTP